MSATSSATSAWSYTSASSPWKSASPRITPTSKLRSTAEISKPPLSMCRRAACFVLSKRVAPGNTACTRTWGPENLICGKGYLRQELSRIVRRILGSSAEQHVGNQQAGADHDGTIREIEHRPLILLVIHQKKIHHAPAGDAVPEIARSPAQNQRERNPGAGKRARLPPQQTHHNDDRRDREADE